MRSTRTAIWAIALANVLPAGLPAHALDREAQGTQPIAVRTVRDLRFGVLAKDSLQQGWASIDAGSGGRQVGGGVFGLGGDYGPAEFEVTGKPDARFMITLPRRIHLDKDIRLRSFSSEPDRVGTFGPDGRAKVSVGGSLDISPTAGSVPEVPLFSVQVNYL